uniref:ADP-ribosylation factor-like protein 6-interacting protein 4 n=1 Tax=Mesocestoides corti TaxID=53468 RepID=A0A0R3UL98_MESCO
LSRRVKINQAVSRQLYPSANYQTRDSHRSRTYSESRGHVTAEIDGLLDDLDRMKHRESLNQVGMTRWSSLGTVGAEGGRYTTTLTRRHMKRGGGREPVDIYLKKPTASGLSKVDLLSVDNRGNTRASAGHSPVTLHVDSRNADREQRLMDELIETRRELQRTRSMMSEDGKRGLNYGSTLKVPVNAGSTRNINIRWVYQ